MARQQAANDNKLVGIGNLPWRPPETPNMTPEEVRTICGPFFDLHGMIAEATKIVGEDKSGKYGGAIYVISDIYGRSSKIGKATSPLDRLAQLQTGNPNKLFIHRLFCLSNCGGGWVKQPELIDRIEKASHLAAGTKYLRLEGEWFACSPSEAHDIIDEVISKDRNVKKCCAMTPLEDIWRAA